MNRAVFPAIALACGTAAEAQTVACDGFETYAIGQVESGANGSAGAGLDDGNGWAGPYNVSNAIKSLVRIEDRTASQVNYSQGEIRIDGGNRALRFYDVANGSFAVRRPLGTIFHAAAAETLWFSVLFRTNAASPLANQDFIQIGFDDNPNPASGNPRVSIGANTTSAAFPAPFKFFCRSTTAVSASAFAEDAPIAAAATYFLVASVRPNDAGAYDTVCLFVNPTSQDAPGPPSATVTLDSGLASLSHIFIRTSGLDNGDAYVLDEWRVARDYASVVLSLQHALRILPASLPGGFPTLRWPAALPGAVLETSADLAPASWAEIPGPFPIIGGEREHPITPDPGNPRGFFRLRR